MNPNTEALVAAALIGREAKADHPVTCLNPEPTFVIRETKWRDDTLYVRGEKTMWFAAGLIELVC